MRSGNTQSCGSCVTVSSGASSTTTVSYSATGTMGRSTLYGILAGLYSVNAQVKVDLARNLNGLASRIGQQAAMSVSLVE